MRLLLLPILLILLSVTAYAHTIIVSPGEFKKAVVLAKNGDTILLKEGVYKEGNLTITKSITIIGQGNVVLDGEKKYEIMTLSGKNIVVKNIHFQNAGYSVMNDFAAIKIIDANSLVIEGNFITNSHYADAFCCAFQRTKNSNVRI